MRAVAIVSILAAALAGAAQAQDVTVSIGADLRDKADTLGQRDIDQQAAELAAEVEEAIGDDPAFDGARIELVLTDLKPNRPTMEQLSDRPGLSYMDSISLGGAAIEGQIIAADGSSRPVRFDWYSNDLQNVFGYTTWHDADRAFDMFARRLAEGRL